MYNTAFKQLIKRKYDNHILMLVGGKKGVNLGDKMTITRQILIKFICESIDELNINFGETNRIEKLFATCVLDRNQPNNKEYLKHLEN